MALDLTAKTRSILNQIEKRPNIILDIEGLGFFLSSGLSLKKIRWDDGNEWDTPGARWDGSIADSDTKNYISLKDSTNSISQQIYPDKEGSSSITNVMIKVIDKNNEVAQAFSSDNITEILGKKCDLYMGFTQGTFPDDYIPLMRGVIGDYMTGQGNVVLNILHADTLRRQSTLSPFNTQTTAAVNSVVTTIPVSSTATFLQSQDALTSYIKIGDEIMEVTGATASSFTVIRGRLNTIAAAHDLGSEVVSLYELVGKPLELAQKIMHSNGNFDFTASDTVVKSFEFISVSESINNAIIFDYPDIESLTGLIPGDSISVETYSTYTVSSFGKLDDGTSYIIVLEDLSEVTDVNETFSFRSQYKVLNFGLGMETFQVDNESFEEIKKNFSPNFIEMTFRFEDGIDNARDFINKELYFASGCYGIPRNARSSVKFLSPPLSIETIPVLNEKNILNVHKLKTERSHNKFYYNDVLFAFNKSVIDGDFKSYTEFIDSDSVNTLGVGKKQLRIESEGYIRSSATDQILDRIAGKFLDRYKGAALSIKGVELGYKTGFNINVGDVVFYGGSGTNTINPKTGKRDIPLEKYEVINQSIDLKSKIKIDLLATGFSVVGNFGVFSPSSLVGTGSTTTNIKIKKINNLNEETFERDKWNELIGAKLRIRAQDYSFDENVTLLGFSGQSNDVIITEALSTAPGDNYIIELANHSNQPSFTTDIGRYVKLKYTFTMDQVEITSVTDNQNFDVDDVSFLFEGKDIAIHNDDYTRDELRTTIDTIIGNTITLTEALSFTPIIGDKVEALDFEDQDGYLLL